MNEQRNPIHVRLTLTSELGDGLGGAWWQRADSAADELPKLAFALSDRLGRVADIRVSWSSCDAVPDLDSLTRRGMAAMPGLKNRPQRVMTLIGSEGHVNVLVVPRRTTPFLAVLILRHAVGLPINDRHKQTAAYTAAEDIVRNARAQCARLRDSA